MPQRLSRSSLRAFQCLRSKPASSSVPRRASSSYQRDYSTRSPPFFHTRINTTATATVFCLLTAVAATWASNHYIEPLRLDAAPSRPGDALTSGAKVELTGKDHGEDVDGVSTGTSSVPYFPRSIWLPRSGNPEDVGKSAALPAGIGAAQEEEEYQLIGLGIRKVSLFKIQVYVVGFYVAKGDMGKLQEGLVKSSVGSGASTLVQGEKEQLKKTLLQGAGSEKVWGEVFREGGFKSAVRIVPVRNTNFSHLRDGWVRGIDARGKGAEFEQDSFKTSVGEFKRVFGAKGAVGKGRVLLLGRGIDGTLRAWVEENAAEALDPEQKTLVAKGNRMSFLGNVADERISRLVWMGYVAGDRVASEEARHSVVEGIMELVERPIGTIETQVV